jgi:hypothetical protein
MALFIGEIPKKSMSKMIRKVDTFWHHESTTSRTFATQITHADYVLQDQRPTPSSARTLMCCLR